MPTQNSLAKPDLTLRITRLLVAELPFALYLIAGALGAFWVSDDFDRERLAAMAYCGMPLAVLYYASRLLTPGWTRRRPRTHATAIAALVLVFTTGVVPLFNAVTAPDLIVKRTIETGTRYTNRDVRRGGLGLLFRSRW